MIKPPEVAQMATSLSRRMFLKSQATIAAGAVTAGILSAQETAPQGAPLRIGVIGVGGRGTYLLRLLLEQGAEVPAVCDIRPARLEIAGKLIAEMRDGQRPATYGDTPTDYRRMLERDDLEAVLIATPMQWHAVMAVDALRAGKHVLSEVAATMTVQECWDLVNAVEETGKIYMLAENCCFWRPVLAIGQMIAAGLFGQLTFAECGYVHDCRALAFEADGTLTWRGEIKRDHRGNWYSTHSLGPVAKWLGINKGDRLVSLVAAETGRAAMRYYVEQRFPEGHPARQIDFRAGDSTTVLIKTAKEVLIDVRYDVMSARPHPTTVYYTIQGTKAVYDSRIDSVWIEGRSKAKAWEPAGPYVEEFDNPLWKEHAEKAQKTGHSGGDYFVIQQFAEAVRKGGPVPVDVYDAAAWSSVMPLSEQSLNEGGKPVEIPDFTRGKWEQTAS